MSTQTSTDPASRADAAVVLSTGTEYYRRVILLLALAVKGVAVARYFDFRTGVIACRYRNVEYVSIEIRTGNADGE